MRYFLSFTVFIFFVLPLSSYSQLSKKTWMIRSSGSYFSKTSNGNKSSIGELDFGLGYFFFDKYAAGLNAKYTYQQLISLGAPPFKTGLAGMGPAFRYYIFPGDSEFNAFSEAFILFLKSTLGDNEKLMNYGAKGGFSIFLTSAIAVELSGGYQITKRTFSDIMDKSFRYRIGFQIFINSNTLKAGL